MPSASVGASSNTLSNRTVGNESINDSSSLRSSGVLLPFSPGACTGDGPRGTSSTAAFGQTAVDNNLSNWPVILAILPPFLSLFYGGKVEEWSQWIMLFVVAFYLYGLVKVPWEVYLNVRLDRGQVNRVAQAYSSGQLDSRHPGESARQTSIWRLHALEWLCLGLVFASPLLGVMFLNYLEPFVHVYQSVVKDFPVALYVLTAYVRPLVHISQLFKGNIQLLQDQAYYPNLEVDVLKRKILQLEKRHDDLVSLLAETKEDSVKQMKAAVEPNIHGLNKEVKRGARKEQKFIDYSIERFRELELRLQEQELVLSRYRSGIAGSNLSLADLILTPVTWTLSLLPHEVPSVRKIITAPINIGLKMVTWWMPSRVKRLVYAPSASSMELSPVKSVTNASKLAPSPKLYGTWDAKTRNRISNIDMSQLKIKTNLSSTVPGFKTATNDDSPENTAYFTPS